ncbi:MAG: hypothetical protein IPM52_09985 [Bacteroidetes bacterium]|nr:hypothetical protein [Bacteroidota bacterium]
MKFRLLIFAVLLILTHACSSNQKILRSWTAPEAAELEYDKIFIIALTDNQEIRRIIEDHVAESIHKLRLKSAKSYEVLPELGLKLQPTQKEYFKAEIEATGSNAVFTITLLDVLTSERYNPPFLSPPPAQLVFYGNFYDYYLYRYPIIYNPGYLVTDKTYLIESNLYDLAQENLVWTTQSQAVNPAGLKTWLKGYSRLITRQLRKDGLLK